jgi:hypothetical protein
MIPEGMYDAIAISPLSSGDSSKAKTPCVQTTFRIENEGAQKGAMIDWQGWLTEKTGERVAETLVLCGFDGTDPMSVMKNRVKIIIEHEAIPDTNPVRFQARIKWINDPNRTAGVVPHDAARQAEVFGNLRGLVFAKREEMAKKMAANGGDASFNYGANGTGPQGAPPPPPAPPPAPAKAPPRF